MLGTKGMTSASSLTSAKDFKTGHKKHNFTNEVGGTSELPTSNFGFGNS